jgi:SulP family sulfate permease
MDTATARKESWHQSPWLVGIFPFFGWLPLVSRDSLKSDFWAGLTGAIVVLPQGVAFATIAGMPPEYGLYAGIVPAIIAALFGSSWHLVSGPTTAASVVLYSSLGSLAQPGSAQYVSLALTLTFLVGLVQFALGAARFGQVVNYISHAVIIGFTAGAAILIMASQIKNATGLEIERGAHPHEVVRTLATHVADINWPTLAVAAFTLLSGILVRRLAPKIPYMIVAIIAGTALALILIHAIGADIPTIGALPASLPPISSPDFNFDTWRQLAPTVAAVTLFALTEALSISRALAVRSGQQIDPNQEFIGQGLSNLFGSFFSGYVATGSFNRSGLNYDAGARTPLAAVTSGILLAGAVLLVAPYARYLPLAAMAGVLFLVAWGLIDFHHIHQIMKTSKMETFILLTTLVSALLLELEFSIFIGVILSLLLFLHKTANPTILVRVPDPRTAARKFVTAGPGLPECPQLRIIRIDGALFFGAAAAFQEKLRKYERKSPGQKHLAIVMNGVNFIDVTGAEALVQMAKRYRARGGAIYLIRPKEEVLARLQRGGYDEAFGRENIFDSKTEALRTIYRRLNYDICRACQLEVFVECRRKGRQEPTAEEFEGLPSHPRAVAKPA